VFFFKLGSNCDSFFHLVAQYNPCSFFKSKCVRFMKIAEIKEMTTNDLVERVEAETANYNCFSLNLAATVIVFSILLLNTTPVLSFLKFLASIIKDGD